MREFGSFSIASNINKVWTLRHHDLAEIPSLFAKGTRLIKDVMIVINEGMIFPLDLEIRACTLPDVSPVLFSGVVDQKEEIFYFVAHGDMQNEGVIVTFSKEPS